jgi:hypothetical protein
VCTAEHAVASNGSATLVSLPKKRLNVFITFKVKLSKEQRRTPENTVAAGAVAVIDSGGTAVAVTADATPAASVTVAPVTDGRRVTPAPVTAVPVTLPVPSSV